jgi:long-chain acyl-CoA synthetase
VSWGARSQRLQLEKDDRELAHFVNRNMSELIFTALCKVVERVAKETGIKRVPLRCEPLRQAFGSIGLHALLIQIEEAFQIQLPREAWCGDSCATLSDLTLVVEEAGASVTPNTMCEERACGRGSLQGSAALLDLWSRWKGGIGCAESQRDWPAEELREQSRRATSHLAALGLESSDLVALALPNTVAFPVLLMALLQLGCHPLLVHASSTSAEVCSVVRQHELRWLLIEVKSLDASTLPDARVIETIQIGPANIAVVRTSFGCRMDSAFCAVVLHPTSGTSGEPRFCVRDQATAVAEAVNYTTAFPFYSGVRIAITTPLSHAFAFGFGFVSALLTDSTLSVSREFNPRQLLRTLATTPCSVLAVVPPMLRPLIQFHRSDTNFPFPEFVFFAGARCNESIIDDFERAFGARVYSIYGSTETGAISTTHIRDGQVEGVGLPLPNVDVALRNRATFESLLPNCEVGEVFVKSSSLMNCYWRGPPSSVDGWFPTGDIGRFDASGNLHLLGRTKDVINVGGSKLSPSELESVLASHPGVHDVAVYPGLNMVGEEIVLAAIVPGPQSPSVVELRQHCASHVAAWKVPRAFHFLSELPRSASGKCLRRRLPGYAGHQLLVSVGPNSETSKPSSMRGTP